MGEWGSGISPWAMPRNQLGLAQPSELTQGTLSRWMTGDCTEELHRIVKLLFSLYNIYIVVLIFAKLIVIEYYAGIRYPHLTILSWYDAACRSSILCSGLHVFVFALSCCSFHCLCIFIIFELISGCILVAEVPNGTSRSSELQQHIWGKAMWGFLDCGWDRAALVPKC